jgi:nucleoside-diphosphate-sugar epimerase
LPLSLLEKGMSHLFVTGVSGLLGGQLMARLLEKGRQLAVLVRPSPRATGRERIEAILSREEEAAGRRLPRPVVFEGELTRPSCGLADADIAWVRTACDAILHNAASLEFIGKDRNEEPWRTNVSGTRNLLGLAERAGIRDFHHVSTAYVCGFAPGPVPEGPATGSHGFRNDYEASKFEAEQLVRSAAFLDRPTFFRPAVIVGDSRTGATSTYHGMMAMLQLMTVIVRSLPADETGFRKVDLRLSMTGEEQRNFIPVDWVAEAMVRLLEMPKTRGRTIHLAPDKPITIRQLIDSTSSYLNSGGVEFCGPRKPSDLNEIEAAAYGGKSLYEPYEQTDPVFETTTLAELLPDLPCPIIDEPMIHRFLSYGDADRWGKKRRRGHAIETWAADLLDGLEPAKLSAVARGIAGGKGVSTPAAIGIEVVGTGGGSWTIHRDAKGRARLDRGLDRSLPSYTLSVGELAAAIHAGERTPAAGSSPLAQQLGGYSTASPARAVS